MDVADEPFSTPPSPLKPSVQELEDRQRSVRAGEAMFDPVKPQQVLDIFNAQVGQGKRRTCEDQSAP